MSEILPCLLKADAVALCVHSTRPNPRCTEGALGENESGQLGKVRLLLRRNDMKIVVGLTHGRTWLRKESISATTNLNHVIVR